MPDTRPRVRWEGPQFTYSSLGVVNREFCAELLARAEVDLSILPSLADDFLPESSSRFGPLHALVRQKPTGPAQVHVAHQWPPRLEAPEHGAWVLMQPWEYGGLPGEWIPVLRDQIDELWVYCSWQRDCAIQSGIPAHKVAVVPIGVDPRRHHPDGDRYPLATRKRTKLLAIGGIIPRKGMDLLVETYLRTFTATDDVCLVVKGLSARWAYHGNQGHKDFAELPALAAADGAAEIEFIGDTLDDEAIASLYRACDVLVAPFRGEGFGLPIAEAMATGLPVIVTQAGPVLDICDATTAYLIPAGKSPVSAGLAGLEPGRVGYWWADPDLGELARLMRHVVANPEEARATGVRGRARVLERFTYARGVEIATGRMRALAAHAPVRHHPPAPFTTPGAAYPLDQPKATVFLHQAAWWQPEWREVVRGYFRAFRAADDVSLVLTLDPAQGVTERDVASRIAAIRDEENIREAEAPDVLLVPDDLDDALVAAVYRAADVVVVGTRDAAGRARAQAVGKPVLAGLSTDRWRAAATSAATRQIALPTTP